MADRAERTPGRWMRIALIVSLAVNLGIAGLVVGTVVRGHPGEPGRNDDGRARFQRPPPELRELGPLPFLAALTPDDRKALLAAAKDRSGDLRQSREALKARFEEMLVLLRSEPFDADAMATLLADQRAAGNARLEVGEALMIARFEAMGAEGRADYADRLDKSLSRGAKPPRH